MGRIAATTNFAQLEAGVCRALEALSQEVLAHSAGRVVLPGPASISPGQVGVAHTV